jgi:Multicopper oxidase
MLKPTLANSTSMPRAKAARQYTLDLTVERDWQRRLVFGVILTVLALLAHPARAESFFVQCPTGTITHPLTNCGDDPNAVGCNNSEPPYTGPTQYTCSVPNGCGGTAGNVGYWKPTSTTINGAIKCQQISGGDGYATMGDGTQTYLFAFGPLSGLMDMAAGKAGTEPPNIYDALYTGATPLQPGDPATTDGVLPTDLSAFTFNGAVGLAENIANLVTITNIVEGPLPAPATACQGNPGSVPDDTVTVYTDAPLGLTLGSQVVIANDANSLANVPTADGYLGTFTITCENNNVINPDGFNGFALTYTASGTGLPPNTGNNDAGTAAAVSMVDGHVDPRPIMDVGVMNGNLPSPLMVIDEDDEFFLTLTNVGMIMRPDLFEQHTVHFHGYPNASTFYDGVPEPSVAINIGGSFTYYYLAPDAGTYFWHCHVTPPEHLQMGMVGQIYVRPRQNRVPAQDPNHTLYMALQAQQEDPRTACNPAADILCSNPLPPQNSVQRAATGNYAYNDGDGSTYYDVEYPIQIHGFDPSFHFVGMTFNPENFADMKDKYFLLNGRSYPDTVTPGPLATQSADGVNHFSQPLPSIIYIPVGGKALLRLSDLDVTEHQTLASLGIPMTVIAINAKLLRDQAGNNLYYNTNSITLGGGESLDVILDASDETKYPSGSVFYLYTPNLDHLSNDAENFGGLMTEVHICSSVTGGTTFGNKCNLS